MEVRMGAFMIHHSGELMVSQHLGRAVGGKWERLSSAAGPAAPWLPPLCP